MLLDLVNAGVADDLCNGLGVGDSVCKLIQVNAISAGDLSERRALLFRRAGAKDCRRLQKLTHSGFGGSPFLLYQLLIRGDFAPHALRKLGLAFVSLLEFRHACLLLRIPLRDVFTQRGVGLRK